MKNQHKQIPRRCKQLLRQWCLAGLSGGTEIFNRKFTGQMRNQLTPDSKMCYAIQ